MRVQFLGTGAAEAVPGLFCNCPTCQRVRELGGRNVRCRSSCLINDDLLIDYGPDTSGCATRFRCDLTKVHDIIFTHSHLDHLAAYDLWFRSQGSRIKGTLDQTRVWGNERVIAKFLDHMSWVLREGFGNDPNVMPPTRDETSEEIGGVLLLTEHLLKPHTSTQIGRYTIHTLRAHHNEPEECFNFAIEDGNRRFMYATDTGLWPVAEWEYLESLGVKFDAVALDCTVGEDRMSGGHHGSKSFLVTHDELLRRGLLREHHQFYAHHFSHQGPLIYDDMVEFMRPHGVEVTYDGMIIEI